MCLTLMKGGKCGLQLLVQPKAKKTRIIGLHAGMVKLAVAAPPTDGKANREVVSFLCRLFELKKNEVAIVAGERSRRKTCVFETIDEETIRRKLAPLLSK